MDGRLTVAFRADASLTIGHGHVMRCLTLAHALRERGATVFFVCREHVGHLCDLIMKRGFAVSRLPKPAVGFQVEDPLAHAAWLGAAWEDDVEQTIAAIKATGRWCDWLIIDHYAVDQRWEARIRAFVGHILVIDDLADRPHTCDILLDQNMVAHMRARYYGKVPTVCTLLLGPRYALLHPLYAELHNQVRLREGAVKRILIFFGGADTRNLTGRSLTAFLNLHRSDIHVDVVLTGSLLHSCIIREQFTGHPNVHLHSDLPSLALLMKDADLAVGGGGSTTWERLCLGLPALVITLAANQRPVAELLSELDLIRWLGHEDEVNEIAISLAIGDVVNQGLNREWSQRCMATLDGQGVDRVCAALRATEVVPQQDDCTR